MENNADFQKKKNILDDLYRKGDITALEWYESLLELLSEYNLENEINTN